jgi:endonuclease/exonuclease/phosphatase family metal-dependent hydrolase
MPGFSNHQWQSIRTKLGQDPGRYGCPIRREDSVVIGSFNALKLGKDGDNRKRWDFLKRFASRFDLLAVQEVMDDLSGIRRLHKMLGASFEMIVSDTTGAVPGARGLRERLAYLYRPERIELKELASDITHDRSVVISKLKQDIDVWRKFFKDFDDTNKQREQEGKDKLSLSDVEHPEFLTFIRTPHCASFSVKGRGSADSIDFLAVNAHLLYGKSKDERTREFFALLEWLVQRAKRSKTMYYKNMILMGDLNMDFESPDSRYADIVGLLLGLNSNLLSGQSAARVNFPFLDVHHGQTSLFNTNARKTKTFDHVAFFVDKNEAGLPLEIHNKLAGQEGPNDYDYGVFDFSELFAQALYGKSFFQLNETQIKSIYSKSSADVSDHMPIWVRIPIPGS